MRKNKKLLLNLQKEIKTLEFEIKHSKLVNFNIFMLKLYKIILKFIQLITPYAVSTIISFSSFSALEKTPFIKDDVKQKLNVMKEIDSFGNIRYEEQYKDYDDTVNFMTFYSKWEDLGNGFYSRNVEKYTINNNITEEAIDKLLNENNISSLRDILGEPKTINKETKNNLTEEEISKGSYLKALIYNVINDNYIMVSESENEDFIFTLLWILVTYIIYFIIYKFRENISSFDFINSVDEINDKYNFLDVDDLKKRLQIKKNNYDRLRGNNHES